MILSVFVEETPVHHIPLSQHQHALSISLKAATGSKVLATCKPKAAICNDWSGFCGLKPNCGFGSQPWRLEDWRQKTARFIDHRLKQQGPGLVRSWNEFIHIEQNVTVGGWVQRKGRMQTCTLQWDQDFPAPNGFGWLVQFTSEGVSSWYLAVWVWDYMCVYIYKCI